MKFLTHDGTLYFWKKIKSYVDTKFSTLGVASTKGVDTVPTYESTNLITSGGVRQSLDDKRYILSSDNREVATTPNDYNNLLYVTGLKNNAKIGSPSSDSYSYLVGYRGYHDQSGGNSHELAFNNTGIFRRDGSTTSWNAWKKLLDSSNYKDYPHEKISNGNLTMEAYSSNEINFGGSTNTDYIYFGYRAAGSKPKPSKFYFGTTTEPAEICGIPVTTANTSYSSAMCRNIQLTTTDPGAGASSTLPNGSIIAVYE